MPREVTVVDGESLRGIALRELGFSGLAAPLARYNDLSPDAELSAGQLLRIPIHVPASDEFAEIVFAKGEVLLNGELSNVDARVVVGDVLQTGASGFMALQFSSGAVVNLQPGTRVTLEALACQEDDDLCQVLLDAEQGRLGVSVDTRADQPADFQITTPFASAAVRGTMFDLHAGSDAMRVAVTEGEVATTAPQSGPAGSDVALERGFGSVTEPGSTPGQPLPIAPAPIFRNVPARLADGDLLRWWPLTDVPMYRAEWSLDSEGIEIVASLLHEGDSLTRTDQLPGDYFLSLRGIDEDQLPGFRATTRVVIADIDTSVTPPAVEIERDGEEFLVNVIDPDADAAGFEMQLSRTADFTDPLSVDVGPPGRAIFRLDADTVHARARRLLTPQLVSAFGEVSVAR